MNNNRYIQRLRCSLLAFLAVATFAHASPRHKKKHRQASRRSVTHTKARSSKYSLTKTTHPEPKELAQGEATSTPSSKAEKLISRLISKGEKLLGKPYRYRGAAPWPLDCSGYVSYLYDQMGISIPHCSAMLSGYTERISNPQPGDLLFFRGRNARSSRVGHVALVVENNGGDLVIMHSTNSNGIIKQHLSSSAYFRSRYLHAGRLPQIAKLYRESRGQASTSAPARWLEGKGFPLLSTFAESLSLSDIPDPIPARS